MSNELKIFNYKNNNVRTTIKDGEIWFVLKDVCAVLGVKYQSDVAARLDEDEKGEASLAAPSYNGAIYRRIFTIINESGLYNVILLSRKKEAIKFKNWVTHEVLPSIHLRSSNFSSKKQEVIMNNELKNFNYENNNVRTTVKDGEVWFVLKDVCAVLDIRNSGNVTARLDEGEKGIHTTDTLGGMQKMTIINESGLYNVILLSRKKEAIKFKHWVTHEVLPSIRKHGAYVTSDKLEELMNNPDTWVELIHRLKQEREEKATLERKIEEDKPKIIFADAVATSESDILIGVLAKILKSNGIEIGQNRLFQRLRQDGFLIRRDGSDYNMPTQKALELGLFKIKETAITHSDGHVSISKTTKVTGKGQQYFVNYFLKEKPSKVVDMRPYLDMRKKEEIDE